MRTWRTSSIDSSLPCTRLSCSGTQPVRRASTSTSLHDRELWDAFDGRILDEVYHLWRELVIFFTFTCDGTEIEKNVSYTPLVIRILNWAPQLRSLLGNLKLVGYLPPGVTSYNVRFASSLCTFFIFHSYVFHTLSVRPAFNVRPPYVDRSCCVPSWSRLPVTGQAAAGRGCAFGTRSLPPLSKCDCTWRGSL